MDKGGEVGWRRSGGCPGRDFLRMGTLAVRVIGSSVLVDVEGDGGGFVSGPELVAVVVTCVM